MQPIIAEETRAQSVNATVRMDQSSRGTRGPSTAARAGERSDESIGLEFIRRAKCQRFM